LACCPVSYRIISETFLVEEKLISPEHPSPWTVSPHKVESLDGVTHHIGPVRSGMAQGKNVPVHHINNEPAFLHITFSRSKNILFIMNIMLQGILPGNIYIYSMIKALSIL
jgi:hypothetical protein